MDMQDRIDFLTAYNDRLKVENAELIAAAAELTADRAALLTLCAELRERVAAYEGAAGEPPPVA